MDKAKNKNSGSFKTTGNWAAWSKQLKEKFSKLKAGDLKFEKPVEAMAIIKPDQPLKIQNAIRNATKKRK